MPGKTGIPLIKKNSARETEARTLSDRPIIFGEVLFDVFPDGKEVPGGAPFNVAWHLRGFGLSPRVLSRIGEDDRGGQILSLMSLWDMDTTGIQKDSKCPTGVVSIQLRDGEPAFDILPAQAYDGISEDGLDDVFTDGDENLFYHGSLAARAGTSRQTLNRVLNHHRPPVFFDVNLRDPWWQDRAVHHDFRSTTWLKINNHELCRLSAPPGREAMSLEARAENLCGTYGLKMVVVTLGEKGAFILDSEGKIFHEKPAALENLVDTVGAGDGFSAIVMIGILRAWPLALTLKRAVRFSSALCGIRGATTDNKEFYRAFRNQWKDDHDAE